jgi:hypothetical protein
LSVFTFASAIARVLTGLDTTTRATRAANSVAIAYVFPVASNATSSPGARLSANNRSSSGVVPTCPACHTTPSCQIATCAKSRWTSSPMHRLPITCHLQPCTARMRGRRAKRHLRIRAHGATGQVAGAANY